MRGLVEQSSLCECTDMCVRACLCDVLRCMSHGAKPSVGNGIINTSVKEGKKGSERKAI